MFGENTASFNIGNLFLLDAGVSQEQLSEALAIQEKDPNQKIGEILVTMGALSREALDAALRKQAQWRKKGPSKDDMRKMSDFAMADTARLHTAVDSLIDTIHKVHK